MSELFLVVNSHFTDEDKEQCQSTISKLVNLADISRKRGLLELLREMENEQEGFLKIAMYLICDSTEETTAKEILENIVLSGEYSGAPLLDRLLITEAALAIQRGENPRLLELRLLSMLGEKYIIEHQRKK